MPNENLIEYPRIGGDSEQIIGSSPALKTVLVEMERVAPTDATVLVLGETGTGKELIARTLHKLSPRREGPFVKLDCAAIRFESMESEIFGHEKGACSGAVAQKIGRFEMADTGTLFLDEIGDLPLALQPKLLRILEEQEFERPGSGRMLQVNVRLIAATHRDLGKMIEQKGFRSDLYYRLNGFPIMLPPLRERDQDIALLVSYFVEIFSRRLGKRIHKIPEETLSAFATHSWPGNVRELQNLIKRAVILSDDGVLPNPFRISDRISVAAASPHGASNEPRQPANRPNKGAPPYQSAILEEQSATGAPAPDQGGRSPDSSPDLPIVFIVADDVYFRESLELLVRHEGWQSEAFAFAGEFLARPRPHVPNCVVLDVSLQDLNGLDLQKRIAGERNDTPVIFVATQGDVPTSVQAMKAGAVEFLMKPFRDEVILGAIREGLKRSSNVLGRESEMRPLRDSYASLSHRERQVMALVVSGLLNKQTGAELGISESTVKGHRGRVMQKMAAKSVPDLVRMATRLRSERAFLPSGQHRAPVPFPRTATSGGKATVARSSSGIALAAVGGRS